MLYALHCKLQVELQHSDHVHVAKFGIKSLSSYHKYREKNNVRFVKKFESFDIIFPSHII